MNTMLAVIQGALAQWVCRRRGHAWRDDPVAWRIAIWRGMARVAGLAESTWPDVSHMAQRQMGEPPFYCLRCRRMESA